MSTTHTESSIRSVARLLRNARHPVFFTGAGISTESGLPDFRGPNGVWTRRDKGLPPPAGKPIRSVRPNPAHLALVELQALGRLAFVISQNVRNLHLRSGIRPELLAELHGNAMRVRCCSCERTFPKHDSPAACECGHTDFKSSVINFGDTLPGRDTLAAWDHTAKADLFVVVGSTLLVTPAADMPRDALDRGADLVILNLGETPLDSLATVRIAGKAGEVLPRIVAELRGS